MIILASAQPGLKTNYKVRTKMEMDGMEVSYLFWNDIKNLDFIGHKFYGMHSSLFL